MAGGHAGAAGAAREGGFQQLMMDSVKDWFAEREHLAVAKPKGSGATPAPSGSGPAGETCKTCAFSYAITTGCRKRFWKCAWCVRTSGSATDIRLKWEACSRWQADRDLEFLEEVLPEGWRWRWRPSVQGVAIQVLGPFREPAETFRGGSVKEVENLAVAWVRGNRPR